MAFNPDKGFGMANRGPLFERQGGRADRGRARNRRRREARGAPAARDRARDQRHGVVPVHFQVNLWATRDGITYVPRTDENTLAWKFKPAGAKPPSP
jgi:peptide/nickel transport system substrate-binding protein